MGDNIGMFSFFRPKPKVSKKDRILARYADYH